MIQVLCDGHRYGNEIRDVIKLFFQDTEIILIQDGPPEKDRGIFLYVGVMACDTKTEVKCRLKVGSYEKELTAQLEVEYPVKTIESKKTLKWELRRLIYLLLEQYTGKSQPWGLLIGIRPSKIIHEMLDKDARLEEIQTYLGDYCRLSRSKTELVCNVAKTERRILEAASPNMVSLYIGIPFCVSRCLYCSFISDLVGRCGHLLDKYIESLKYELEGINSLIKENFLMLQSIYVGGGTPTSIGAERLSELLMHIEKVLCLESLQEYTLEAGRPDSIDINILKAIKASRVDRISINPQTMNDETLKLIGRNHTSADIINAFSLARKEGFGNINMDVIAGLPGENIEHFRHTMAEITELKPESLTVHTLSVKRGSKLHEERDSFLPADVSTIEAMVEMGREYACRMGMHPYYLYRQKNILGNLENTGYSKPGSESIYNVQIMDERQTILAAGAGAVTKVYYLDENRLERAFNVKSPDEYINRIEEMLDRKRYLFSGEQR